MSNYRLMGEESLKALAQVALGHSCAEQTEVGIQGGYWALTRFANSTIHQNMGSENVEMHVRAVFGKKVASASTNILSEEGIRALVDRVVEMARLQDPNPDFVSLPEPTEQPRFAEAFSQATAESAPEERAQAVKALVEESDKVDATAAGSLFLRTYERAVFNSLGVNTYFKGTAASLTTVVTGPDGGFGYASRTRSDVRDIDPRAVGKEAAERAYNSRNPVDLEPGEYETILMPYAVATMVGALGWAGVHALPYQENRSFMSGKLGQKIVSEKINIWDDALDPRTLISPYDREGVAKQRVDIIKDGVASAVLQSSYTAHREGKKSTGHASGSNLIMAAGDASVEDMIASTKRGVLVTRFHYTNLAHLMTVTLTGMTRDGTFLIEDGKIVGPVKNLRITQSVLEALSNVEMIGRDVVMEEGVSAPAIKVSKFRFSSATEF
ncbi:MAG: TldD/PmbA family protein [Armatimonadetes bacterium]|nr:TldD/PmbA family protein [Armatimonadota bacterium]